jgi:hypothetical protein
MDFTGLVLDSCDDLEGAVLQQRFPDGKTPGLIKAAQNYSSEELKDLPDECFALCAINDGQMFRKFAVADPGMTAKSVVYFLETKDHLPKEAQKVASANLVQSCLLFDITPPEPLLKLAGDSMGMEPYLDVTGLEPDIKISPVTATLDTPEKVAYALEHFEEIYGNMHPRDRHQHAVPLLKVASLQGVETNEMLQRYGSETFATNLDLGRSARLQHLAQEDVDGRAVLNELYKNASASHPEDFAEALALYDVEMGLDQYWDRGIQDPWFSTFGRVKFAEWAYVDGNDRVTAEDLQKLVQKPILLYEKFDKEMVDAFRKDPIGIFESLPSPDRKAIMRTASEQYSGGVNALTSAG